MLPFITKALLSVLFSSGSLLTEWSVLFVYTDKMELFKILLSYLFTVGNQMLTYSFSVLTQLVGRNYSVLLVGSLV